ncbi:response regulator transcription factor [Hyphomicrobium sulfonivorans]|uniref:response regulator n=1 Tax=Hyphomicrobium sulfonivorans TaxID=121290 RepID=UPI001571331B|nr:response regulator transcription factor [Hyphomicrobium sulfonivorans]MBI1649261.1 response regulator transcription factor [Hyphomicrobium sulfonivorans]NSL70208.1 DNA-binding response regulator [Hyphomicrobium sulfonivorans]
MRLLIVEDNEQLSELISSGLRAAGFATDSVTRADQALAAATANRYAAIILDLGLPDQDGSSVLATLRQAGNPTPVLILTARDGVDDRVAGLRAGADDYLVKPFAFAELIARIEALLRRPGNLLGAQLQLGDLTFDTQSRQAIVDGHPVLLSVRETTVLELLMRRKGNVVSRKAVEDHLFGLGEVTSNAAEVYVHRLRKQLAAAGASVKIATMRGVGYVMKETD